MLGKIILRKKKYIRTKLSEEFGKWPDEFTNIEFVRDRLDEIGIYLRECMDDQNCIGNSVISDIDDVTWNDLEMDEIFLKINHTRSFIGEQVMYKRLRSMETALPNVENRICFLANNEEKRIDIEQKLQAIGKHRDDYYLPMILWNPSGWKLKGSVIFKLLQFLLIFLVITAFIWRSKICVTSLLIIAVVNLTLSMLLKNKYDSMMFMIGGIKQIAEVCQYIKKDKQLDKIFLSEKMTDAMMITNKISKYIGNFQIRRNYNMSGEIAGLILDYILGITLYDIVNYNKVIRFLEKYNNQIIRLYEFVGELDMDIAIASFRESIRDWCIPDFSSDIIYAKKLRHPALENCIPNDISIKNGIILTGANASGKSTFMKSIAINVILSKAVNTAYAKEFSIPANLKIMSSMALRDDVLTGESYYIKEINQLKKMLDMVSCEKPTLIIIDEILKGTNSVERVASSYGVLNYLRKKNAYIVVATHDIRLVELVKDSYKCFYFGSDIINDKISFDYKLHCGINNKNNAIQLLELIGFPEDIIEKSRAMIKELTHRDCNVG